MSDVRNRNSDENVIDKHEITKQAYNAVESAANWLAEERQTAGSRAKLPYSDKYTELAAGKEESGFMSSAEGMTALFQVITYTEENESVYFTPRIDQEILTDDVEWLLQNNEEGGIEDGSFRATPYLPSDATSHFTDAVSFCTTTLMECLGHPKVNVSDEQIINALEDVMEWFLTNYRESINDHDGIGWAWCGSEDMDNMSREYPPQRYFTFSGTIALADLYKLEDLKGYDDEAGELLSRALKGLLADYWVEGRFSGWTEFTADPYGQGLRPNSYTPGFGAEEDIFSTSNTLMVTAYIWNELPDTVYENANLTEEEIDQIPQAIDFLVDNTNSLLETNELHRTTAEYVTDVKDAAEERKGYFDGTLPYTVLNTLGEIYQSDGPFDHRQEEIEGLRYRVAKYILDHCWDSGVGNVGFKHIDPNRDMEPTVIYATQVGIESLLNFELKPPEEGVKYQVINELEKSKEKINSLLDEKLDEQGASGNNISTASRTSERTELLERNNSFARSLVEARVKMETEFETLFKPIDRAASKATRNNAQRHADDKLEHELKEVNVEVFLDILNDCYFAQNAEEFYDAVDFYKNKHWIFVTKPHQDAIETLESLDESTVNDFNERADIVQEMVEGFAADIFQGYDPEAIGKEFNDRNFA